MAAADATSACGCSHEYCCCCAAAAAAITSSSRKILTGKYPGRFLHENPYLNIFEKIVSGKYYQKYFLGKMISRIFLIF
jgi:hypothetical protein